MIQRSLEIIIVSSRELHCCTKTLFKQSIYCLDDCTFLIESPPGTRMYLNATISIVEKNSNEECMRWLKLYDFYSNATLIPFGE